MDDGLCTIREPVLPVCRMLLIEQEIRPAGGAGFGVTHMTPGLTPIE
jgi:hypothetical protein